MAVAEVVYVSPGASELMDQIQKAQELGLTRIVLEYSDESGWQVKEERWQ